MKTISIFNLFVCFFLALSVLSSCNNDDESHDDETEETAYHAHIMMPNEDMKMVGDSMAISVNFEEHNGGTIHHVNVRIFNAETNEDVYNKPTEAHIHADESYTFEDVFVLDVPAHEDYTLEAKVWGSEAGEGEVTESVTFHVHMN